MQPCFAAAFLHGLLNGRGSHVALQDVSGCIYIDLTCRVVFLPASLVQGIASATQAMQLQVLVNAAGQPCLQPFLTFHFLLQQFWRANAVLDVQGFNNIQPASLESDSTPYHSTATPGTWDDMFRMTCYAVQ